MSRFLSRAGQAVAELAELSADEGRLSRGRALFRKGSVSDLDMTEGTVTASVRGSQGDHYETTISTTPAPPGVRRQVADAEDASSVDDLIDDGIDVCPRAIDLAFDCDCADWEEPCKHVVAVLFAFADRVDLDEALLLHWRGLELAPASGGLSPVEPGPVPGEPDAPMTASGGWRSRLPEPAERDDTTEDEDRDARLSRLRSLLGDALVASPPAGATEPGPETSAPELEPALASFLGAGEQLEPIDLGRLAAVTPTPLFTGVELGPLADLGPELARALAIIADRLEDSATDR